MSPPTAVERLSRAGLRVTAPRVAVLDALTPGEHLAVDEITRRVRGRLGSVSTQAVYDVLRALDSVGLVRRLEPAGSPALYESRAVHHHHLVCRACGVVADADCARDASPCLAPPPDGSGFVVDAAEVTFWGLCGRCAATGPAANPSNPSLSPTEGNTP